MTLEKPNTEETVKITIPNEDMKGWIETLMRGGFEQKEIDLILGRLNKEYARLRGLDSAEKRLRDLKDYLINEHGKALTPDEEEYFLKNIQRQIDNE